MERYLVVDHDTARWIFTNEPDLPALRRALYLALVNYSEHHGDREYIVEPYMLDGSKISEMLDIAMAGASDDLLAGSCR